MHAVVGSPGAVGDSWVWEQSDAFAALQHKNRTGTRGQWLPKGCYIVGDMAYKLRPYQMRPFKEYELAKPEVDPAKYKAQIGYNKYIRRVRRVVERVFGVLKKRFLVLITPTEDSQSVRSQDVWCAMVLHNILLDYNYPVNEDPVYSDPTLLERVISQLKAAVQETGGTWNGLLEDEQGDDDDDFLDEGPDDDVSDDEDAAGAGVTARDALVGKLLSNRQAYAQRVQGVAV